jgi:glycosyltransferase involved in cell wall biosynthesis
MRRRLTRVLVTHSSDEMYGADFILLRVLTSLRAQEIAVKVILPNDAGGHRPLSRALGEIGCEVEHHPLAVLRRRYFTPRLAAQLVWDWIKEVLRLRRLLKDWPADLVYSNTLAVTASAAAARITRTPHVWHVHEIVTQPAWLGRALAALAARLSTRVIAVSSAVNEHLKRAAPGIPSVVIRNGIPDPMSGLDRREARQRVNQLLGISDDVPLVLMIGRVSEWKGATEFVRLAEAHIQGGGCAHFLIVGGGVPGERTVLEQVRNAVHRAENRGALHWLDFTRDIAPFLARATMFVLPSIRPDPFPTVVLEAMFAELPIVAFDHGGVIEMIKPAAAGITASVGNLTELRQAVEHLLLNPAEGREMGRRARARALQEFTPEQFETRILRQLTETAAAPDQ